MLAIALPMAAWRLMWPVDWRPGAAGTTIAIACWGVGLFLLIMMARLLGIPFGQGLLVGAGLTLIAAAATLRYRLRNQPDPFVPPTIDTAATACLSPPYLKRLCQVVTITAWTAITVSAFVQPLSGWDNEFRWDYLARHALELGRWDFYPPVSAADFREYGWCDAIPPFVPWLNAWIYALSGKVAPALTGVRIGGEAALLLMLIHAFARDLGGKTAGWLATAIWSASAVAVWSVQMGQESGWLAISLVGMLWSLNRWRLTTSLAGGFSADFWIAAAAVFAGLGGITREYGLSFSLLGLGVLWTHGGSRTSWTCFIAIVAIIVTPWYTLVAWRTGNPLYPLSFGGWLPTNIVHEIWQTDVARGLSWSGNVTLRTPFTIILTILLGPWIIGGVIAGAVVGTRVWPVVAGIFLMTGLWLWSIPYTAGGWIYAARVSAPAIALGAILLGTVSTRITRRGLRTMLLAAMVGSAIDATARSHFLPSHPELMPWAQTPTNWDRAVRPLIRNQEHEIVKILVQEARGGGIVVEHPQRFTRLREAGGNAIPLWSPEVLDLLLTAPDPTAKLEQLRAAGIRFVWVDVNVMRQRRLVQRGNVLGFLIFRCPPIVEAGHLSLWDLNAITSLGPGISPTPPGEAASAP